MRMSLAFHNGMLSCILSWLTPYPWYHDALIIIALMTLAVVDVQRNRSSEARS